MNKIPKPQSYDWKKHTNPENKSRLSNSRTVPDMNYSVREILNRFTTGQPINNMVSYNEFDGEYLNSKHEKPDFEGFMPHPKTLDLVDRQLMAERTREELKNIDARQKDRDKRNADQKSQEQEIIKQLNDKIQILENPAGGK